MMSESGEVGPGKPICGRLYELNDALGPPSKVCTKAPGHDGLHGELASNILDEVEEAVNEGENTPADTLRRALALIESDEDTWTSVIVIATENAGYDSGMRLIASAIPGGKAEEMGMLRGALLIVEKDWVDGPINTIDTL